MSHPNEASPSAPSASVVDSNPVETAERVFDHGDFVQARRLAAALVDHPDPAVRARARALLDRLRPDPVIVAVMLATGVLIVSLALSYLGTR